MRPVRPLPAAVVYKRADSNPTSTRVVQVHVVVAVNDDDNVKDG